jgi:hypothetical protein
MSEIETREESNALQVASDALDRHLDSYDRELFRHGWLAGRDWARNQEMLAQIEEQRQQAEDDAAASERMADIEDRIARAGALGRHLHDLYNQPDGSR